MSVVSTLHGGEQAAVDAISKVVNVTGCERLDDRRPGKTPDWRLTLDDGRVADVEVTRAVDQHEASLHAAVRDKNNPGLKEWGSEKLSYRWTVFVSYSVLLPDRKRHPLKRIATNSISALVDVEAEGGSVEQMMMNARVAFIDNPVIDDETIQVWVDLDPPKLVGDGQGAVLMDPYPSDFFTGGELGRGVREAITKKTAKRQLDDAPSLRWLTVMVAGNAALLLTLYPDHEPATSSTFHCPGPVFVPGDLGGSFAVHLLNQPNP